MPNLDEYDNGHHDDEAYYEREKARKDAREFEKVRELKDDQRPVRRPRTWWDRYKR